jgi:hypothetical protein
LVIITITLHFLLFAHLFMGTTILPTLNKFSGFSRIPNSSVILCHSVLLQHSYSVYP